jgi:hypothetical protein
MKLKSVLVWTALTVISVAAFNVTQAETQSYAVPGRYVVVLKHGHAASAVAEAHGLKPDRFYSHALNGFAGIIPEGRLLALQNDPRVESLEPDLQLVTTTQTISTGIRRIGADRSGAARINGVDERVDVDIAILDTGIAPHPVKPPTATGTARMSRESRRRWTTILASSASRPEQNFGRSRSLMIRVSAPRRGRSRGLITSRRTPPRSKWPT